MLRLVANGKDNGQIAAELVISPKTVKNHISNILMKLQIQNRIQAAVYAVRSGLGLVEVAAALGPAADARGDRVLALASAVAVGARRRSAPRPGGCRGNLAPRASPSRRWPAYDGPGTGALAVDLATGRVVFAHNAGASLLPASNEKLALTYAALVVARAVLPHAHRAARRGPPRPARRGRATWS